MLDLLLVGLVGLFFVATLGLVWLCQTLLGDKP